MALRGSHVQGPAAEQEPRGRKSHPVATVLALVVGAVALVCGGLAVGTLYGPAFLRANLPTLADDLGVLVVPEPVVEQLEDGFGGELARRVAAVSAELGRSAYDAPTLEEATAGALQGLVAATDPGALYLAPEQYESLEAETPTPGEPLVTGRLVGTVGVVQVARMDPGVAKELRGEVQRLIDEGASSFVLDLRGNPGGSFNEAVACVSLFLTGGTVVEVIEADGSSERVAVERGAQVTSLPLALLVDGGTASAAEVVVAALQDHDRATVIGETTAGQGVVRSVKTLSFGGAVAYATAEFLTPDGHKVDGVGITPDIEVSAEVPEHGSSAVVSAAAESSTAAEDSGATEDSAETEGPAANEGSTVTEGSDPDQAGLDRADSDQVDPDQTAADAQTVDSGQAVDSNQAASAAQESGSGLDPESEPVQTAASDSASDQAGMPASAPASAALPPDLSNDPQLLAALELLAPELFAPVEEVAQPAHEELQHEREEEQSVEGDVASVEQSDAVATAA